jgi:hypothetical protein
VEPAAERSRGRLLPFKPFTNKSLLSCKCFDVIISSSFLYAIIIIVTTFSPPSSPLVALHAIVTIYLT